MKPILRVVMLTCLASAINVDAATETNAVWKAGAAVSEKVSKKSLRQANDEVLKLRLRVWQGWIPPVEFYAGVQKIYERRFGPDYGTKVQAFLDLEATRAKRVSQAVAFDHMSAVDRDAFFIAMPKGAELHLHLTGAIPAATIMAIGEQLGADIATVGIAKLLKIKDLTGFGIDSTWKTIKVAQMSPELRAAATEALITHDGEDFPAFLNKWNIIGPITADPRAYYPMIQAMATYANRQNIVYLELMVSGQVDVLQAAVDAAQRVQAETGVTIRIMPTSSWGTKQELVDASMAGANSLYDKGVVGYNMVADERISPLGHYASFEKLRKTMSHLQISLHAGEQPGTAGNIVNDMLLNVKRYGHATHAQENPLAETVLYNNKTPVEVSLISNQDTRVMSDLSHHPMQKFLAWNVPVIPSTDDPGVFKSTLSEEYDKGQKQFGFVWSEIKEMSRNGIRYSFADAKNKALLMKDLNRRFKEFENSPLFKKYKKR
jgi:adenosine deaminase